MTDFGAILTAMVTPFDAEDRVDEEAIVRLVDHLLGHGSDGVVVAGTTGEASTLEDEEHLLAVSTVIAHVRAHHPGKSVIAGASSNSTRHMLGLTQALSALEPDGLLSVNPYYNRPSRAGIVAHFRAQASATHLPVILYNIPQRTGADLSHDLLTELAQLDRICAVKQANPVNLAPVDGLSLYAGNDDLLAATLDQARAAPILTGSHVAGPTMARMVSEPAARAEIDASLADLYRDLAIAPAAVTNKAALNLMGVDVGAPRLPYVGLEASETAIISALLARRGLLADPAEQIDASASTRTGVSA